MLRRIKSALKNQNKCSYTTNSKILEKAVSYGYKSVVADHSTADFLKYWYNNSLFPQGRKCLTGYTKVIHIVSSRIKISEQPLMKKDRIPCKPTHFEGFRRFTALLTASVVTDCGAVTVGQDMLKIDFK